MSCYAVPPPSGRTRGVALGVFFSRSFSSSSALVTFLKVISSSSALTGSFHPDAKKPFCVGLSLIAGDGLRGEFSQEDGRSFFFPVWSFCSSSGGVFGGGFPPSGGGGTLNSGG